MSFLKKIEYPLTLLAVGFIRLYKLTFSHIFRMGGNRCRFYPDCSSYGLEAVKTHGAFVGGWLTVKRVVKCGPFHPGGIDKVPTVEQLKSKKQKHTCCSCESKK